MIEIGAGSARSQRQLPARIDVQPEPPPGGCRDVAVDHGFPGAFEGPGAVVTERIRGHPSAEGQGLAGHDVVGGEVGVIRAGGQRQDAAERKAVVPEKAGVGIVAVGNRAADDPVAPVSEDAAAAHGQGPGAQDRITAEAKSAGADRRAPAVTIGGVGQDPSGAAVDGHRQDARSVVGELTVDPITIRVRPAQIEGLGARLRGVMGHVGQDERTGSIRVNRAVRRRAAQTDLAVAGLARAHVLQITPGAGSVAEDDGIGVVHRDGAGADRSRARRTDGAGTQRRDDQGPGIDRCRAGVRISRPKAQDTRAGLDQTAPCARQDSGQISVISPRLAVVVDRDVTRGGAQVDRIGEGDIRQRAGGVEDQGLRTARADEATAIPGETGAAVQSDGERSRMGGETATAGGAAPSDRSGAGDDARRRDQVTLKSPGQLDDARCARITEHQRTVRREGGVIVERQHAFLHPGLPRVAVGNAAEVPLTGGGLGEGGDVRPRPAVRELGIESIVPGGSPREGQGLGGGRSERDGPGVAPDDGIVIRCRAGKHRAGAGDGEEAVSGGGIRTEVQAADEIIALIDEGRSAAVED